MASLPDSGDFLIGSDHDTIGLMGDQKYADLSFDGANYLVVWNSDAGGIIGARITPEGQIVDPGYLGVDCLSGWSLPNVAYSSAGAHLVVWNEGCLAKACRVTSDGQVLDFGGFLVSPYSTEYPTRPSVASDGHDWLVAWPAYSENSEGLDLWIARVTPEGQVQNRSVVAGLAYYDVEIGLCYADSVYWAVWNDQATLSLRCARISREGTVISSACISERVTGFSLPPFCYGPETF